MKRFIQSLLKFALPFLIMVILVNIVLKRAVNLYCDYKFDKKYTTIILGHSQPEHAFNDSLIENTKNLCSGGEASVYTYLKLKKIISENPQVTTVLLSFSNNQLEEKMTDWTFGSQSMNQYFSKYNFIMDSNDYALFTKSSFKNMLDAEVKSIVSNAKIAYKRENRIANKDFGGYMFSKRMKVDSLIQSNYIEVLKKERSDVMSQVNLDYLEKCITFCKEKNIKVILFRAPIHRVLFEIQDENLFQKVRREEFNDLQFIDLYDFSLSNDEYGDFSHLNYKGAIKVSKYLNEVLHQMKYNKKDLN